MCKIPNLFSKYLSKKETNDIKDNDNLELTNLLNNEDLELSNEDKEELNKFKENKIDMLLELDEHFVFPLIELFYAYCGAILLDTKCIESTFIYLKKLLEPYMLANSTINIYDEHPKTKIYYLFLSKINYFKKIKEK